MVTPNPSSAEDFSNSRDDVNKANPPMEDKSSFAMDDDGSKEEEDDEVFNVLLEVNLIHEAVKRKCRLMVEFLLQYKPDVIRSRKFQGMFTPVVKGQCGFTPLHLAATMCQAEEMIEILTNDPNEVKSSSLLVFYH